MPRSGAGALILSLLLYGCGGESAQDQGVVCTLELRPGIAVTVLDDATGAPASCGARAVFTSGSFSESVENPAVAGCPNSLILSGAHERPGVYTVTVSRAGYRDFIQNNVVVSPGVCHVVTAQVTARLVPL